MADHKPYISYAQNYEDVMLLRAFKDVSKGFFIDAGANDPIGDSVTYAFYERGWTGINIEPLPSHFADLQRERPRDINLNCAAGAETGAIEVHDFGVIGWASADPAMIDQRRQETGLSDTVHHVPVRTLKEICSEHVTGDIHFLKVDVEGFEHAVLRGMDFDAYRPWIVLVEAQWGEVAKWERLILDRRYSFIYEDGVNRFYLAKERAELASAFKVPPNVEDGFIRLAQHRAELRAAHFEQMTANLQRELESERQRHEDYVRALQERASAKPSFLRHIRRAVQRLVGR